MKEITSFWQSSTFTLYIKKTCFKIGKIKKIEQSKAISFLSYIKKHTWIDTGIHTAKIMPKLEFMISTKQYFGSH